MKNACGRKGKVSVMKIEEMYKEINASDELKKAISEIKDTTALEAFLKEHDCEATADEFVKYIESQCEGEMRDDVAAAATGGNGVPDWRRYIPQEKTDWDRYIARRLS